MAVCGFKPNPIVKGPYMSIITISRGSYSRGKEVAEKVAAGVGL